MGRGDRHLQVLRAVMSCERKVEGEEEKNTLLLDRFILPLSSASSVGGGVLHRKESADMTQRLQLKLHLAFCIPPVFIKSRPR